MLNLLKTEIEFIDANLENTEELLKSENVNNVLDALSDWVLVNGLDENDDLTDEGRMAQRIYDSIYLHNEV